LPKHHNKVTQFFGTGTAFWLQEREKVRKEERKKDRLDR
jgi:hypothetical protein